MLTIIPGKPEHFEDLDLRQSERESFMADPTAMDKITAMIRASIYSTLIIDDKILAIIGYYEMWPGVIEVWIFPSIHVPYYATPYLRCIKRHVKMLWKTLSLHRMQTTALADEIHDKWMEFLGFTKEGVMINYTADKKSYTMWSITNGSSF